jgi:hypothetical protein
MKRIDLEDSEHAKLVLLLHDQQQGDDSIVPIYEKVRDAKRFRPLLSPYLTLIVSAMLVAYSVYHGHRTTKAFNEWQANVDKWHAEVGEWEKANHK